MSRGVFTTDAHVIAIRNYSRLRHSKTCPCYPATSVWSSWDPRCNCGIREGREAVERALGGADCGSDSKGGAL